MARVNIVGDGPGGLSAALFLAKNGHEVKVFGQDTTAMNFAYLYNYLDTRDRWNRVPGSCPAPGGGGRSHDHR
jgi:thioredoxin reductase